VHQKALLDGFGCCRRWCIKLILRQTPGMSMNMKNCAGIGQTPGMSMTIEMIDGMAVVT